MRIVFLALPAALALSCAVQTNDELASSTDENALKKDSLGIAMLYPSKSGGDSWTMNPATLGKDPRVKFSGTGKPVSKDIWNGTQSSKGTFRLAIAVKDGFKDGVAQKNAIDHAKLAKQGFMQGPGDWRNIEMTGYFHVNKVSNPKEEITMYARGGAHNDDTEERQCQGTAYKSSLKFAGGTKFAKEYHHNGGEGYVFPKVTPKFTVSSIMNRWIGMKTVIRNVKKNGGIAVNVQVYVDDKANNNWKLWYEVTDDGSFAGVPFVTETCGAESESEIISWGGPEATFRIDDVESIDFRGLSIREITP